MLTRWRVAPQDPAASRSLSAALGIHPVIAQILLNRGLADPAAASRFLAPDAHAFADPYTLPDMDRAVARLRRALAAHETVLVFGDSDVDGLTASVIVEEVLSAAGLKVAVRQANRIADGYGLPEAALEDILDSDVRVVILVDCGTNQLESVARLTAAGIDTLILDHHAPLDGWAQACALVNPFRSPGAPGRELCSAGLAFKLAQAWLGEGREEELSSFLDLAALGLLADCAPLRGESRQIVSRGLGAIVNSGRPGLRRLCEATGTANPDPQEVLRKLVPKLNAAGRLGDCLAVRRLLCRHSTESHEAAMTEVDAAHEQTKALHRRIMREAMAQAARINFGEETVVVVAGTGWHRGLMGPLASQLAQSYARPAIALALEDGFGVGSARSVPSIDVLSILQGCAELLHRFGGHAQACGLSLSLDRLDAFRLQVNRVVREAGSVESAANAVDYDLDMPLAGLETDWVGALSGLAPFGMGNPQPTVVVRNVRMEMKSPRRGWISNGASRIPVQGTIPTGPMDSCLDVAGSPWMDRGELTLRLRGVRIAAEL